MENKWICVQATMKEVEIDKFVQANATEIISWSCENVLLFHPFLILDGSFECIPSDQQCHEHTTTNSDPVTPVIVVEWRTASRFHLAYTLLGIHLFCLQIWKSIHAAWTTEEEPVSAVPLPRLQWLVQSTSSRSQSLLLMVAAEACLLVLIVLKHKSACPKSEWDRFVCIRVSSIWSMNEFLKGAQQCQFPLQFPSSRSTLMLLLLGKKIIIKLSYAMAVTLVQPQLSNPPLPSVHRGKHASWETVQLEALKVWMKRKEAYFSLTFWSLVPFPDTKPTA